MSNKADDKAEWDVESVVNSLTELYEVYADNSAWYAPSDFFHSVKVELQNAFHTGQMIVKNQKQEVVSGLELDVEIVGRWLEQVAAAEQVELNRDSDTELYYHLLSLLNKRKSIEVQEGTESLARAGFWSKVKSDDAEEKTVAVDVESELTELSRKTTVFGDRLNTLENDLNKRVYCSGCSGEKDTHASYCPIAYADAVEMRIQRKVAEVSAVIVARLEAMDGRINRLHSDFHDHCDCYDTHKHASGDVTDLGKWHDAQHNMGFRNDLLRGANLLMCVLMQRFDVSEIKINRSELKSVADHMVWITDKPEYEFVTLNLVAPVDAKGRVKDD